MRFSLLFLGVALMLSVADGKKKRAAFKTQEPSPEPFPAVARLPKKAAAPAAELPVLSGKVVGGGRKMTAMEMAGGEWSAAKQEPVAEPSVESLTIADLVAATPQLSTLLAAVQAAGLTSALASPTASITVFAPTNDAFAAILSALDITPAQVLADSKVLQALLSNHVVAGEIPEAALSNGQELTTLLGGKLKVEVQGANVTLVSDTGRTAAVVRSDIKASNGVVHVISGVLTPTPAEAEAIVPSAEFIAIPSEAVEAPMPEMPGN